MSLNTRRILWLLAALMLAAGHTAHAADGTAMWTNIFNGAGNNYDQARALAVDASGNVFVTGSSTGIGSSSDYATIKYSSSGLPMWTNFFNGAGNSADYATALTVDGSGNVLVTGSSYHSGIVNPDYATIKYSGAGVPLWTNFFNSAANNNDYAGALAVDGSGNVYVTGNSTVASGYLDYATIKYSSAGLPMWTNFFNGAANNDDYPEALAVDGIGNVFVTGSSTGIGSGSDYATIKYSSAGVPLWTNFYNGAGNGNDIANALAVDGSGNVIVTGFSTAADGIPNYATIKYSGAGVPLWTNIFNGGGNRFYNAYALGVDSSGNVFVTGQSAGSGVNNDFGFDYVTIKYTGAGVPIWTNLFNGGSNGYIDLLPNALVVDGSGNAYVAGYSFNSGGNEDYATIKYSGAGVPLWTNLFNGAGNGDDRASALAVDGSGNVFVTGASTGSGSGFDYATIKYSGPVVSVTNLTATNWGFAGKQFRFTLTGPAGSNAVIAASTNLINWTPLVTNPLGSGSLIFTDAVATNFPRRFYRATLTP